MGLIMAARVALVTGSGKKRVGAVVADALARHGHDIAVHYHTSEVEAQQTVNALQAHGVRAVSFRANLSDETAVQQMIADVLSTFSRIDVLVNCAAIWNRKRLEEVTAEYVRSHFEINALGTFLCCQHAGLAMTRQPEGGVIINLGDWAEVRPYLDYAAYFPSKGAVSAITRTMAVELAARNPRVRVNAILPGPVMLPPDLSEEERRGAISGTLLKREGNPEHIARAVLSMVDNDFITGVLLPVDGGRTLHSAE